LASPPHAAPVADQIAAQLAAKIATPSGRFDITLDPAGLGHVNVSVQISASGQVTASLTFDNPHAAAEAQSGAGALQHALEQAGFTVAQGGLSFDVGGQGANLARQNAQPQTAAARFAASGEAAVQTPQPLLAAYGRANAAAGLDITI
jgi:flagellar hook-length control protein FliK